MINIRSASTLRLFVPVRGRPAPEVKWGKADGEIKETAQIDNTGSYASLVIENVDRFDSGKYTLTAENASGVKSVFISVRVLDSPSPPTNFMVKEITKTSVTLTWEPPLLDGGSKIKHYIVEKRESTRKVYSPITTCNRMSWKVEPLPEGGIFFFRVLAENEYGVGLPAKTLEPIKISEKPQPPGKVSVVDVTHSTVTLTWEKPEHDGGSRISHYEIELSPKDSEAWSVCASVKALETVVTNLLKGEEYQFRVVAVNDKGKSDPRQLVHSVVAKDLVIEPAVRPKVTFINVRVLDSPSAPINLEVKDVKRNSVSLSWEPPLIDGGAKISHYIVEKREQKRMAFTSVCLPASTDQVKVSEAPLPPGKIVLVDVTRHTVTLSWEKPDHDGGSKITNYIVEMQPKGDDKWTVCSEVKALEATIEGLVTGEEYSFRVFAVNDKGKSDAKPLAAPVVVKDITVEPIINLLFNTYSVKAGDDLKIDVPFKGRPQPEVSWKKDGQALKQTTRVNVLNSKTSSKITIKDATKEDVGKYEITLTNSVGTKTAEISVIILDKPGSPSNIKVDEVSADFICLSWDPPTYDGGCQINNYVVEKRDTTTTTWQIVSATVARTSIKVTRLNQGTEYQFRIAAENRYGKSHAIDSGPVVAQYPFEPPGPPTNLHVAHATKTGMLVVWGRPASDGGSPVIGYHIECKDQSSLLWTKVNRGLLAENQFKMTGIEESLLYQFRVYAENIAGIGPCSKPSEPVAARDPCESPHNLRVTNITRTSVSLFWEKPEYDGGVKITGYIVERKELPNGRWLKCNFTNLQDTYFDVTGLTEDVQYDFRVIAKNSAEMLSAPSESTGPVTVKDDVDPPTIILEDKLRQLVVIKAGEIIKIDAEITGRPLPVVSWSKDGKEIVAKARCEITSTNFATTLIVRDAIRRDSGQYVLTLHNVAGTRSVAINCKVLDRPGPSSGPLAVSGLTESVSLAWAKPEQDGGSRITGYLVEALEKGQEKWVKCGVTKSIHLTVSGLRENAEYFFRVRAENHAGFSDVKEMVNPVLVKDQLGKLHTGQIYQSQQIESPEINMKDFPHNTVYVRAGSTLKCEIPLTGRPLPKVTLSKDNVLLKSTMRFNSEVTPDSIKITLRESIAGDSGRYDITASNSSGTTKSFVNIECEITATVVL
uniref:Titin n=1 Tax=Seriola dumerili TaxID=41447 RepID=A0A3B4TB17_SERDU